MDLKLLKPGKASPGVVTASDAIFAADYNESLVHQVVTSVMAAARQGTKAQKTRAEVSGGGKKPWRQKGTSRARAGTTRGPFWRKGGVTFAAQPRNYEKKVNRKMYRAAVRSIFSELARQDRLVVVESFDLAEPKTKLMLSALANLGLSRDVLIVSHEVSDALYLASRNLHDVDVRDVEGLDPVSLVGFGQVVVTAPALKLLEEKLA